MHDSEILRVLNLLDFASHQRWLAFRRYAMKPEAAEAEGAVMLRPDL
jgi:hypothetical protein